MAIDSVNNSGSNAGLYAGGAALVGAGAGAATGYLTKPFLKDGAPTDSFCKALGNNLVEAPNVLSAEGKEFITEFLPIFKKMQNANNAEELNKAISGYIDQLAKGKTLEEFQECVIDRFGISIDSDEFQSVNNAKSLDEVKDMVKNVYKEELDSKGFKEAKAVLNKYIVDSEYLSPKGIGTEVWGKAWDSKNNKLIEENISEEALAVIKKTMHSFQGKAAMLYGAIGAGVLGWTALLCCSGGKKEAPAETSQKVDTQA